MTEIPCATDPDSLLAAAWAAADLHANAMDRNSQHTIAGLSVKLAMGTLTQTQAERLLAYWSWWEATWNHYETVKATILAGGEASFDPSVPGPCPCNIWALKGGV